MTTRPSLLRQFAGSDRGASLVEFGLVLPMLILLFGVIIEGGRLMWSYQSVVNGVRDATRYLGRIAPTDVCSENTLAAYTGDLYSIVRYSDSDTDLFPTNRKVTINSVTAACVDNPASPGIDPVVAVTARVTIDFPFGGLFEAMGADSLDAVTASITDRSRVLGI